MSFSEIETHFKENYDKSNYGFKVRIMRFTDFPAAVYATF